MTITELHKILDDDNKKLTLAELKQVIYELKQDCDTDKDELLWTAENDKDFVYNLEKKFQLVKTSSVISGKQNAFQICLDLLEHLEEK